MQNTTAAGVADAITDQKALEVGAKPTYCYPLVLMDTQRRQMTNLEPAGKIALADEHVQSLPRASTAEFLVPVLGSTICTRWPGWI
jgi:hypothetical protein